jgi:hypothetical protein
VGRRADRADVSRDHRTGVHLLGPEDRDQGARLHRYGGRIAIVLAALIAYFCITDVGAPHTPWRVAIHAIFGATAFALLGVKFGLIRFAPDLAYDAAPWIGRAVAVCFVVIWITSGLAFFTGNL